MTALLLFLACAAEPDSLQASVTTASAEEPAEAAPEAPTLAQAEPTSEPRAKAGGKRGKNPGRPAPDRGGDDEASDAAIVIDSPEAGAAVSTTIDISGTAMVNEGQLTVELRQKGQAIASATPRADQGAPERGKWSTTLQLPTGASGAATLHAFSLSAKDGSPENEVQISLTLK